MDKLYNFFGGRKTTFALLMFIAVTVFLYTERCDFSQWSEFMIWGFGVYALGNGAEHIAKGLKK